MEIAIRRLLSFGSLRILVSFREERIQWNSTFNRSRADSGYVLVVSRGRPEEEENRRRIRKVRKRRAPISQWVKGGLHYCLQSPLIVSVPTPASSDSKRLAPIICLKFDRSSVLELCYISRSLGGVLSVNLKVRSERGGARWLPVGRL